VKLVIFQALPIIIISILMPSQTSQMNANNFLQQHLRMLSEITPLQKVWISLEDDIFSITSVDQKVNWGEMKERALILLKESMDFVRHFAEDASRIKEQLDEEGRIKMEPFLTQSFIYTDVISRTIDKLALMVKRLYEKTQDPSSYTAGSYLADVNNHKALCDEYHAEGEKMNEEFKKLKDILVNVALNKGQSD